MDLDLSGSAEPSWGVEAGESDPVSVSEELELRSRLDEAGWTVRLAGTVSGASARALCERLVGLADRCRSHITLDVRNVRELTDFGAAILSHGLHSEPFLRRAVSLKALQSPIGRKLGRFGIGPPPG
ncbi:MAG: hypothetical protein ACYCWW_16155 [Deltaproteobacteria bacterium]